MPGWFKLAIAGAVVFLVPYWADYVFNWRWVLAWLVGTTP